MTTSRNPECSEATSGLKASVCICIYNGAGRIRVVIEALSAQSLASEAWEVLVVDNASTDGTGASAAKALEELLLGKRGRIVREERPGLSFARARAAREARGEILCFLDDDNLPAPDFVANAIRAFSERPKAGAVGGKVLPVWEVEPTPLALAVQDFALAICDLGGLPRKIECAGGGIVGAGLCVRRAVLEQVLSYRRLAATVIDRQGSNLTSGGDLAVSVCARQLGWECWYDPSLVIRHLLPARRMEKDYLLRLYEGIGRGQSSVRKLYDWKARTPLSYLIGMKDLARWVRGRLAGPSAELRAAHPAIAQDLHELHQRMLWGRAVQAFRLF